MMGQHELTELEVLKLLCDTLCEHRDKFNEFVLGDRIVLEREGNGWHYFYEKQCYVAEDLLEVTK